MLYAVEASIPVGPFHPVSIPSNIDCRDPAYVHGTHPAKKSVGFDTLRAVPPADRAEQSFPRLEVRKRRAANNIALKHHRLRLGVRWFESDCDAFRMGLSTDRTGQVSGT